MSVKPQLAFVTQFMFYFIELDLVPFLITVIACLVLGIEVGILIGVIVDVIILLYYSARPKLLIENSIVSCLDNY